MTDILLLSGTESEQDDESELLDEVPAPEYTNIYFHHGKLVKAAPATILGENMRREFSRSRVPLCDPRARVHEQHYLTMERNSNRFVKSMLRVIVTSLDHCYRHLCVHCPSTATLLVWADRSRWEDRSGLGPAGSIGSSVTFLRAMTLRSQR